MNKDDEEETPAPVTDEDTGVNIEAERDINGPVVIGNQNVTVTGGMVLLEQGPPPKLVPRQGNVRVLPGTLRYPVGQAPVIENLTVATRRSRVVQLYGPSGSGKSTIIRYAALKLPPGPHGVVFVQPQSAEIRDVAQQLFEACYENSGYYPAEANLRNHLTGKQITVFVDDADFDRKDLIWLTDVAPDASFVFASQEQTLWADAEPVEVPGLDLDGAIALLAQQTRRPVARFDRTDAGAWRERTHGLPLFLVQVARLVTGDPEGVAILPPAGEVTGITRLLLSKADDAERQVLRLLATLDGAEIAAPHIAALTGIADAAQVCGKLAEASMILGESGMYRCPPEVIAAIRGLGPPGVPR